MKTSKAKAARSPRRPAILRASRAGGTTEPDLSGLERIDFTAPVELNAAAAEGKRPTFTILAYTGGPMQTGFSFYPVVVELSGLKASRKKLPILFNHDDVKPVGQADKVTIDASGVDLSGTITGDDEDSKRIVAHAKNGFEWQASIGASVTRREFIEAGKTIKVNGRDVTGPCIIAREATLIEVSFVTIGADQNTSAKVAATRKDSDMNFQAWLKAKKIDNYDSLSEGVKAALKAAFDAEEAAAAKPPTGQPGESPTQPIQATGTQVDIKGLVDTAVKAALGEAQKTWGAEQKRVADINRIAARHPEILAKALSENWDATKTELEVMKASRPTVAGLTLNAGGVGADKSSADVITAALCLTAGINEKSVAAGLPTADREKVMNAALSGNMRGYSLHALMDAVIHAAGQHFSGSRKSDSFITAALQAERVLKASGFSSVSLSGILANVANKGMLASYTAVEVTWPEFCAVRSHSDFKVNTRYRLDSTGAFKKVAPDGELKHVGLTDASYTNQLGTFGAIIALTRQMQINDDMGAFMEIPNLLGRMAALRLEEAVYVLLLSNPSSFFHANNRNLLTGASSALTIEALSALELKFMQQVDSNNKPILVSPKKLLVGSTLKSDAQNIFDEKVIVPTGLSSTASRKVEPAKNKMYNKYAPIASPYIDNTAIKDQDGAAISGQSSTKFWLFADPAVRAALAVAFLNGQRTPTIESAETEFSTLGMQWRAFHDFGVGMEETSAAAQSDGA